MSTYSIYVSILTMYVQIDCKYWCRSRFVTEVQQTRCVHCLVATQTLNTMTGSTTGRLGTNPQTAICWNFQV